MNEQCKRCHGWLMGSERRGEVCNRCLSLGYGPDDSESLSEEEEAARLAAKPLPIPSTPRHGRTNYFPRKPSSFATTDLTGADAATMEATIRRDFGRFMR